ncbi:hypothetical protein [Nocardia sp. NPDC004860]|uniref:hypothetical protein n=1 Tax=Nocardia sp. NPDC004860 TaxID=3154557 RepID=UPI0033B7468D
MGDDDGVTSDDRFKRGNTWLGVAPAGRTGIGRYLFRCPAVWCEWTHDQVQDTMGRWRQEVDDAVGAHMAARHPQWQRWVGGHGRLQYWGVSGAARWMG